jgi:hypothetical protein
MEKETHPEITKKKKKNEGKSKINFIELFI